MAPTNPTRIHKVDFCAQIASYWNIIFSRHPEYPFTSARIEGFGRGAVELRNKIYLLESNSGFVVRQ